MFIDSISSAQNPKIKDLLNLQEKSKYRKEKGLIVIEGERELKICAEGGFSIETIFFCEEYIGIDALREFKANRYYSLSKELYSKVAYRGTTEGVIALAISKERTLGSLVLGEAPLILVVEGIEKPGNLGAILRSADAAAVDAVIVCDYNGDIYNPNTIRSSIGGVFSTQLITASSESTIEWLKAHKVQIVTAQLQDSLLYYDTDMTKATAIVVGAEDKGLSNMWREASDAKIRIPMLGKLDSLNVSVSAAILCFEALRQRS